MKIFTFQPSFSANKRHPSSQLPSQATSRKLSAPWNCSPQLKPRTTITGFSSLPASSRLISRRGHFGGTLSTREEKGCTTSDVPRIISRSQRAKSSSTSREKRFGRLSPKNTASGFTIELHSSQRGTTSLLIFPVPKRKLMKQFLAVLIFSHHWG